MKVSLKFYLVTFCLYHVSLYTGYKLIIIVHIDIYAS